MKPRYHIGQKVRIKPLALESPDLRHATLNEYAGQVGTIVDSYWINMHLSAVSYIYKIKAEANDTEIVVHEDEIEEFVSSHSKSST